LLASVARVRFAPFDNSSEDFAESPGAAVTPRDVRGPLEFRSIQNQKTAANASTAIVIITDRGDFMGEA
jgi:hypothetical protein